MNVLLSYTVNKRLVNIVMDASISEQHTATATITDHPVETGASVTDNVRPMPRQLTIECIVTNTPIVGQYRLVSGETVSVSDGVTAEVRKIDGTNTNALQFSSEFDRVRTVFEELEEARKLGALVSVDTTLDSYQSMAIASVSIPRNAATGSVLQFQLDLREIITVDIQEVEAPPEKHKPKKKGEKPTKEATKEEEDKGASGLTQILGRK